MATNDPSPEEIADLERQQREAELQAEFEEFEREERNRKLREREAEKERASAYNTRKTELEGRLKSAFDTSKRNRDVAEKERSRFKQLDEEESARDERNLQMEFDLFERKEKERRAEEERYDRIRRNIEISSGKKSYTGFRAIDEYLDAADTKKSKAAADKWEREYKDIEAREKSGKISPDYASFLKTQAAEKLQAGKKSKARYFIEEAQRTGSGLIAAGSSYLSNAPSRGGGGRKPSLKGSRSSRKAAPRQNGFSSGMNMGVSFPQMMVAPPQMQGRQPQKRQQPSPSFGGMGLGFPSFSVSTPKSKGGGKPSGPKFPTMSFAAPPKFGKSLLKPRDPFGAKKTNPLKGKRKSLW